MLRLRFPCDFQPRSKNGQPAQSTTGVASTSWIQLRCRREEMAAGEVPAHLEQEDRQGQHQADPEAARDVDEFGFGPSSAEGISGSSAMPQIGQLPGPTCRIFGMHGAGVDGAGDDGLRDQLRLQVAFGVGGELGAAARAAEMIGCARVFSVMRRLRGVHGHAADGILRGRRRIHVMVMPVLTTVVSAHLAAP
jgi:hypothetical protein